MSPTGSRLRMLARAAVALGVTVAACASSGVARAELPTLYVTYSSVCTFTITNDAGATVSSIAPGSYDVELTTPSPFATGKQAGAGQTGAGEGNPMYDCNGLAEFQLSGPGVSIASNFDDGSNDYELYSATFEPSSTYTAVDENQPSVAVVTFTTTASGAPSAPAAPTDTAAAGTETTSASGGSSSASVAGTTIKSASLTFEGTLEGVVAATGKLTLTFHGKKVSSLPQGKYRLTVVDKSKTAGFIIQERDGLATTVSRSAAVGTHSVTLTMKAGQWFYYPSFVGAKSSFLVIG